MMRYGWLVIKNIGDINLFILDMFSYLLPRVILLRTSSFSSTYIHISSHVQLLKKEMIL